MANEKPQTITNDQVKPENEKPNEVTMQAFKNVFAACKMANGNADFHVMVGNSLQILGRELNVYE